MGCVRRWTKIDWLLFFLSLVPFGISAYLYPQMPDVVPTHWNVSGNVDGYGPKVINLFLLPTIALTVLLGLIYVPKLDPFCKNYEKFAKAYQGLRAALVLFLLFIYSLVNYIGFSGQTVPMNIIMPVALALLFGYLGYLMPSFERTFFVGFRTPWTLSSDEVWRKTHQLAGRLFIIAAVWIMIGVFIFPAFGLWIFLVAILFSTCIPLVFSYFEYQKAKDKDTCFHRD
ncbi:MAG: DUF1648 domain-containing protein [Patescibacteria group bacterium]|nr:DUF1648 domain-containing protein [Patescibacteria group bacterium]